MIGMKRIDITYMPRGSEGIPEFHSYAAEDFNVMFENGVLTIGLINAPVHDGAVLTSAMITDVTEYVIRQSTPALVS